MKIGIKHNSSRAGGVLVCLMLSTACAREETPFGVAVDPALPNATTGSSVAASYSAVFLTDLRPGGPTWPKQINLAGNSTGYSAAPVGGYHAVTWDLSGALTDLGIPYGNRSYGEDINDYGSVAGWSASDSGPVPVNVAVVWNSAGSSTILPPPTPAISTQALGINNAGTVVGFYNSVTGFGHAFRYTPAGGSVDINPSGYVSSLANKISNGGVIVGVVDTPTGRHAARWDANGNFLDLGTINGGDSEALGVNAAGTIVGYAGADYGVSPGYPFIWTVASGLRTLGQTGIAWDVSDLGRFVGQGQPNGPPVTRKGNGPIQPLPMIPPDDYGAAVAVNRCGHAVGWTDVVVYRAHPMLWRIAVCD